MFFSINDIWSRGYARSPAPQAHHAVLPDVLCQGVFEVAAPVATRLGEVNLWFVVSGYTNKIDFGVAACQNFKKLLVQSKAVYRLTDQLFSRLSLPGHREERWDCVQGCKATGHPHPHGDVWRVPEENSPHHRRLHPQLAPTGPDWSRGYGGGGVIVTGDQHDAQLWICWIYIHCGLRCINTHRCVICSCDI